MADDVNAELLQGKVIAVNHRDPFYRELIEPLRAKGRDDLARTIEGKLAAISPPNLAATGHPPLQRLNATVGREVS